MCFGIHPALHAEWLLRKDSRRGASNSSVTKGMICQTGVFGSFSREKRCTSSCQIASSGASSVRIRLLVLCLKENVHVCVCAHTRAYTGPWHIVGLKGSSGLAPGLNWTSLPLSTSSVSQTDPNLVPLLLFSCLHYRLRQWLGDQAFLKPRWSYVLQHLSYTTPPLFSCIHKTRACVAHTHTHSQAWTYIFKNVQCPLHRL